MEGGVLSLLGVRDGPWKTTMWCVDTLAMNQQICHLLCCIHGQTSINLYRTIDDNESLKIPQSLSKPVYWEGVACSTNDLTLFHCAHPQYTGYINDVTDVLISCKKCKCS